MEVCGRWMEDRSNNVDGGELISSYPAVDGPPCTPRPEDLGLRRVSDRVVVNCIADIQQSIMCQLFPDLPPPAWHHRFNSSAIPNETLFSQAGLLHN